MDWLGGAGAWCVMLVVVVSWLPGLPGVAGHGRLLNPPSRSSMWRVGFNNPPNYDDNQLFCGGFSVSIISQLAGPVFVLFVSLLNV